MPKYVVTIHGENCVLWRGGATRRRHEFYVARYVGAANASRAEQLALGLVQADRRLVAGVRNDAADPIRLEVEEVAELASFGRVPDLLPGFHFFAPGDEVDEADLI